MDVPRRGVEAAMAQQNLDGPQVGPAFEQMGREAMAQSVDRDVLAQSGVRASLAADLVDGVGWDGLIRQGAGEEVAAGPNRLPVGTEDLQQPRREHDVAVLLPLALANADHHPLAVDVLDT